MVQPQQPDDVKLICGMISAEVGLFGDAAEKLAAAFGPIDLESEVMDFNFTHYYDEEMGCPLYRRFLAFEPLVSPDVLIEAKCLTNALESAFAAGSGAGPARRINLDPGYITSAKLVLASMKNFSHRIYLGRGVYGEVTLMWRKGRWQALPWTFPDYASGAYHGFLTEARRCLSRGGVKESVS
ncbi:MAG: DUF4416 family protein [Planctomycetota bacterium]|nr:DUF4416 family protein [Planctomycetota bacterium]